MIEVGIALAHLYLWKVIRYRPGLKQIIVNSKACESGCAEMGSNLLCEVTWGHPEGKLSSG